jgi:hypothetical protein
MAGPIISKLLTDFFNEIGPLRQILQRKRMSAVMADVAAHATNDAIDRFC